MSEVLWSELEKGLDTTAMRRTHLVLGWLIKGHELKTGGRTIALVERVGGGPYFALKASREQGGVALAPVALGMEPDIGLLHSFVKSMTEEEFKLLAGEVALTEINQKKT